VVPKTIRTPGLSTWETGCTQPVINVEWWCWESSSKMFDSACGTQFIPPYDINCTQLLAGYAMMAARYANDSNKTISNSTSISTGPAPDAGRMETTFQMVVELYIISLLAAFGLIGNVLSVIVLRQDRERRDALLLLQASPINFSTENSGWVISIFFSICLLHLDCIKQ